MKGRWGEYFSVQKKEKKIKKIKKWGVEGQAVS